MAVSARAASRALALCTQAGTAAGTAAGRLAELQVGACRALAPSCRRPILSSRRCLATVQAATRTSRAFSTSSSSQTPLSAYRSLVSSGKISSDPRQEAVMAKLTTLAQKVHHYQPPAGVVHARKQSQAQSAPQRAFVPGGSPQSSGGFFGSLFGGSSKPAKPAPKTQQVEKLNIPAGTERGLYIWGGCGTGKTFMMDLFHDNIPIAKKRRVHFHEWMIEVHEKLHRLQKKNALVTEKANATWDVAAATAQRKALKAQGYDGTHAKTTKGTQDGADDLVGQVAQEMMDEAWLLCFDEFQVTHISDAIIMKRLFSILFEKGAVIVATSNRPPPDLYLNGLNRPLFTPFIPMLQERCVVHDIESAVDYRLLSLAEEDDRRVYITATAGEDQADLLKVLERKFYRLCQNQVNVGTFVETQGRRISVAKCGASTNVAWFNFKDLCDKPLGAADYFAICTMFHTVFVANIPKLTLQERDQVRRMITMIDSFYEKRVKLVCTAGAEPLTLFSVPEEEKDNTCMDEIFAWDRTASRLIEMQSVEYLSEWIRDLDGEQLLAQYQLTSLSHDEITDLWTRYDKDGSGAIDVDECRRMLEDVMEVTQSHRHVSDDLFNMMFNGMDTDGNKEIDETEFRDYVEKHGLTIIRTA